jgi:hypothetical protein
MLLKSFACYYILQVPLRVGVAWTLAYNPKLQWEACDQNTSAKSMSKTFGLKGQSLSIYFMPMTRHFILTWTTPDNDDPIY